MRLGEVQEFHATEFFAVSLILNSVDIDTFTEYAQLRNSCCTSYKDDPDLGKMLQTYSNDVIARNGQQVLAGAVRGDVADLLEAGLRLWTGCGMPQDQNRAVSMWIQINEDVALSCSPVPRRIKVRAIACLANSQWELKQTPEYGPDIWNIDSVYRAAAHADECAAYGFYPPIVLFIGKKIREVQEDHNIPEARHARFQRLTSLWELVERRNQEVLRETQQRHEKVAKAPTSYVCAAEGCGIEGTKKSALLRCAGKCPVNIKPSYCSKECQIADWRRHKPVCKPSAASLSSGGAADAGDASSHATTTSHHTETEPAQELAEENDDRNVLRTDGKELRTEIRLPGQGTHILTSKTVTSEFMKEIRDAAEKLSLEDSRM